MKPNNHSTCTDVADILKVQVAHQQRNSNDDARKEEFDWLSERTNKRAHAARILEEFRAVLCKTTT